MVFTIQRFIDNFTYIFQPVRKPRLLKRIGAAYIRYMTARNFAEKPLRNVDVALSYDCNLNCRHCSCDMLKQSQSRLRAPELRRLANEAQALGAFYFSFTGGEPLINKDLEEIIRIFRPEQNLIGLQTNATLLDARRLDALYQAGVDVLQISVDSYDAEEHDDFRGKRGAYRATMKAVDAAVDRGLGIILCTTISHQNIRRKGLIRLLETAMQRRLPVVVSIACPVGRWAGRQEMMLDDDDRRYLKHLQQRFPSLRRDFESNYLKRGCSACVEKLYVTPYGDVIPCPFIHITFGNIRREPLRAIRERMLRQEQFTKYSDICLAGEDRHFFNTCLCETYKSETLPLNWRKCGYFN